MVGSESRPGESSHFAWIRPQRTMFGTAIPFRSLYTRFRLGRVSAILPRKSRAFKRLKMEFKWKSVSWWFDDALGSMLNPMRFISQRLVFSGGAY